MASKLKLTFPRGVLLAALVMLGAMGAAPARHALEQRDEIRRQEAELRSLQQKTAALEKEVRKLDDPEHQEKLARQRLGLVRPGEIAYVVVRQPSQTQTVQAPRPKARPWHVRALAWLRELLR